MPSYDYVCQSCGAKFELFKSINDPHPSQCPSCHDHALERVFLQAPNVEYKGDWFKNKGKY